MMDKRKFFAFINTLKKAYPNSQLLLEVISEEFDRIKPINETEIRALKQFPIQFVKRIYLDNNEWTSQLHIWAENGVEEILDLDPIYLAYKNSYGDTVLMSLIIYASGTHTNKPNYKLLEKILEKDYTYKDFVKNENGEKEFVLYNVINEKDINGKTPIDYLNDIAYAKGDYSEDKPDFELQKILEKYNKKINLKKIN